MICNESQSILHYPQHLFLALYLQLDSCEFNSRPLWLLLGWGGQTTSVFHQATQANSATYLSWTGNEYQPKSADALQLWSKGRYFSFHLWINVWVAGKNV